MTKAREPFVMIYRSVLESPAWQRLGRQARRFIEFLMSEHMKHGGQRNGSLLAFLFRQRQERSGHVFAA